MLLWDTFESDSNKGHHHAQDTHSLSQDDTSAFSHTHGVGAEADSHSSNHDGYRLSDEGYGLIHNYEPADYISTSMHDHEHGINSFSSADDSHSSSHHDDSHSSSHHDDSYSSSHHGDSYSSMHDSYSSMHDSHNSGHDDYSASHDSHSSTYGSHSSSYDSHSSDHHSSSFDSFSSDSSHVSSDGHD